MRGLQFLAYHFNFIPLFQREMCIACWFFLLWCCVGCCTGQACSLQCAFSCVLQILYTLFHVQFSVTDWQFESFSNFARVFRSNFLLCRKLVRGVSPCSTCAILQEGFQNWRPICKFCSSNCNLTHMAEYISLLFLWVKSANVLG